MGQAVITPVYSKPVLQNTFPVPVSNMLQLHLEK